MSADGRPAPDRGPRRPWLQPAEALNRVVPIGSRASQSQERPEMQVRYGYRVAGLGLLVGERVACEVIGLPTVARIPTTPAWLLGVANLRGSLVPMFDLRTLLGLHAAETDKDRCGLIFDRGEAAVGLLASERPKALRELAQLTSMPPVPAAARDFMDGAYQQDSTVWLEFDLRRFFASVAQRMSTYSAGEPT